MGGGGSSPRVSNSGGGYGMPASAFCFSTTGSMGFLRLGWPNGSIAVATAEEDDRCIETPCRGPFRPQSNDGPGGLPPLPLHAFCPRPREDSLWLGRATRQFICTSPYTPASKSTVFLRTSSQKSTFLSPQQQTPHLWRNAYNKCRREKQHSADALHRLSALAFGL